MIITHIIGGLGNQMFQYAMGRSLSLAYARPLRVDLDTFRYIKQHQGFLLDKLFEIPIVPVSPKELSEVLGVPWRLLPRRLIGKAGLEFLLGNRYCYQNIENSPALELAKIQVPGYLRGCWQSEQFFADHSDRIAQDFRFVMKLDSRNQSIADEMAALASLSIHVRRGDYVSTPEAAASYEVCNVAYYQRAIEEVATRTKVDKIYVFSDDANWVRKNVRVSFPCEYIAHNVGEFAYRDMQLMTYCKTHIVANSSFSWWGAWLANAWGRASGLVVAPRKWGLRRPMPAEVPAAGWLLI